MGSPEEVVQTHMPKTDLLDDRLPVLGGKGSLVNDSYSRCAYKRFEMFRVL